MPVEANRFTFLQLSDVHLDLKPAENTISLPASKRQERNAEILEVLRKALRMAADRKVDCVIIPGDLFSTATITGRTIDALVAAFSEIKEIPIIIAPGNRDCLSPASPYHGHVLSALDRKPWPSNVLIFTSEEFQVLKHPTRKDVCFTGRAFIADAPLTERPLAKPVAKSQEAPINILVCHCDFEGYQGADSHREGKQIAPVSLSELKNAGFAYAALGHLHDYTEITDEAGTIIGAYAGSIAGQCFDEPGARGVIFGEIAPNAAGQLEVKLNPEELDHRRMIAVGADVSGLAEEDMLEEILLHIEDNGGRAVADIIYLHLEGRYEDAEEVDRVLSKIRELYYYVVVDDNTRPNYLSQTFDERTTEFKFVEAMIELKKRAEKMKAETEFQQGWGGPPQAGEVSGQTVEDGLYYGLDALKQKKVNLRNVD